MEFSENTIFVFYGLRENSSFNLASGLLQLTANSANLISPKDTSYFDLPYPVVEYV